MLKRVRLRTFCTNQYYNTDQIVSDKKKQSGFWNNKENIIQFLNKLKLKYNIQSINDWNKITTKQIKINGGSSLLIKYSLYDLKYLACPEGKLLFDKPKKSIGYWDNNDHIFQFLNEIKEKYNLITANDWNLLSIKHIQSNGGNRLLSKYSLYDLKCMACPEGKQIFNKSIQIKPSKYWENKENVYQFLNEFKENNNLNSPNDWNLIKRQQIQSICGNAIFNQYSMYDLKCMACPEGKSLFDKKIIKSHTSGYWNNKNHILQFLNEIKEKYNLKTPNDWNEITSTQIQSNGGSRILNKYSMYDLKCMGCPEGKLIYTKPNKLKYPENWNKKENVIQFLHEIKEKFNLNTPDDWNKVTKKQIQLNGGKSLLYKYSLFELKCLACPEGKFIFSKPNQLKPSGYWNNKENIENFIHFIKEKYNLQNPDDWNKITTQLIQSNGGSTLLLQYSLFELKCMACPEGKLFFHSIKSNTFWDDENNVCKFLDVVREKFNLKTIEDWNSITRKFILSVNGGGSLLHKYSMYDLKCLACPEGELFFDKPNKPIGYWDNEENRNQFVEKLKLKYNLLSPQDWKRLSKDQIRLLGGNWLFYTNNNYLETIKVKFEIQLENGTEFVSYSLKELLQASNNKRSSQRWLFLQIQKLFPGEEIVEDYFHSEISRETGFSVQFDVFMINKKIAIEYHGQQHYEDIPSAGFASLELHHNRDLEKEKLCSKYGIKLIVIPYWWDNKLESLKETLYTLIK